MATLKICIHKVAEGCQAIKTYNPFPCDLTIDAENAPKSNPKCWDIVNGAIVEDLELDSEFIKKENDPKQWISAFARQEDLGYDSNYMALISGITSACAITGTQVPALAQQAKNDLDSVWIEKYRRVSENDLSLDYSDFGSFPVSYSDLRSESEG
jgi:hypothetical protein